MNNNYIYVSVVNYSSQRLENVICWTCKTYRFFFFTKFLILFLFYNNVARLNTPYKYTDCFIYIYKGSINHFWEIIFILYILYSIYFFIIWTFLFASFICENYINFMIYNLNYKFLKKIFLWKLTRFYVFNLM